MKLKKVVDKISLKENSKKYKQVLKFTMTDEDVETFEVKFLIPVVKKNSWEYKKLVAKMVVSSLVAFPSFIVDETMEEIESVENNTVTYKVKRT